MRIHLVVVRAFAGYRRGDTVIDPATVLQILTGESAGNVVRVSVKEA